MSVSSDWSSYYSEGRGPATGGASARTIASVGNAECLNRAAARAPARTRGPAASLDGKHNRLSAEGSGVLLSSLLQIVAAGTSFICTPVAVWDGDGPIWCAEGPKVRIAGVAAREMDGTCKPNQPCPTVAAVDARDRLVRLLGGRKGTLSAGHVKVRAAPMTCISEGSAGGPRTAAWCTSPAFGDLSCAVVGAGGAVRWARYWRNHRC